MGHPLPGASPSPAARVASVDLARGAVMVLMAIDHVRVFAGVPAGGPEPAIFLTRWITHFCAPVFFFLAGASAFFYGRRHDDLPRFLATRGLWLVLLELTFCRLAWTFNLDFAGYQMAGVLWALGWSMVALALLVRLPMAAVAAVGLALVFGHNLMDARMDALVAGLGGDLRAALWKIAYVGFFAGPIELGPDGPRLVVLYSLVPWIGVMASGYAFGRLLLLEPRRRDRLCLALGLGATALFVALRLSGLYGDPRPWQPGAGEGAVASLLSFLNTSKYPASLQFLLMTLGPAVALLPALERTRGALARWMTVFGRVPFFFYLLHIPLIHLVALAVSALRGGTVDPWLFANHPLGAPPPPDGYAWGLPLLYLVWALVVAALYVPCRWFAGVKARHRDRWLSYL